MATTVGIRRRVVLEDDDDVRRAAVALASGAVVVHGFGNIYAITARGDARTVAAVNALKGRPAGQVGSLTGPSDDVLAAIDRSSYPAWLRRRLEDAVGALVALGPIGVRGPAGAHVPPHLTTRGRRPEAQAIVPGIACPSNVFLRRAAALVAPDPLFVTSANRSHHRTGAADEPAHWRAAPLAAELGGTSGLVVLEHADEDAALARFPDHAPTSTTVVALPDPVLALRRPHMTLERHGSLARERLATVLDGAGLTLVAPPDTPRLVPRRY